MKRIIATLLCLAVLALVTIAAPKQFAYATSQTTYSYARADKKDSYFYTDKNTATSLFAVPYTYCVTVIRDDGDWYYVKYAEDTGIYRALYGYCQKADFTHLDSKPEVIYLYKLVTVTYTVGESTTFLPVLNQWTADAAFYGTYYSGGAAYSYVFCNSSFGYISGANDDYPLNAIEEEQPASTDAEQESATDNNLITALVLAFLAVAVLLILLFTASKHSRLKQD
jgi:hypothetical protein